MIHIIGDGQQAKVVRFLVDAIKEIVGDDYWIIAIGDNRNRMLEAQKYQRFWTLIHPSAAWVGLQALGEGSTIGMCVSIGPSVRIGKHCIINDGARLTHDIEIGDFCHIAPGAILCGNVHVGEGALVGAGAICLPGARIEPWTTVKAGSVVQHA